MMGYSKNRRCRRIRYRRFAAWLLSLAMLLDCFPVSALAEEPDYVDEYQDDYQEDYQADYQEEYQEEYYD